MIVCCLRIRSTFISTGEHVKQNEILLLSAPGAKQLTFPLFVKSKWNNGLVWAHEVLSCDCTSLPCVTNFFFPRSAKSLSFTSHHLLEDARPENLPYSKEWTLRSYMMAWHRYIPPPLDLLWDLPTDTRSDKRRHQETVMPAPAVWSGKKAVSIGWTEQIWPSSLWRAGICHNRWRGKFVLCYWSCLATAMSTPNICCCHHTKCFNSLKHSWMWVGRRCINVIHLYITNRNRLIRGWYCIFIMMPLR